MTSSFDRRSRAGSLVVAISAPPMLVSPFRRRVRGHRARRCSAHTSRMAERHPTRSGPRCRQFPAHLRHPTEERHDSTRNSRDRRPLARQIRPIAANCFGNRRPPNRHRRSVYRAKGRRVDAEAVAVACHRPPKQVDGVTAMGRTQDLTAGQMLVLPSGEPHSLKAVEAASLLVTVAG